MDVLPGGPEISGDLVWRCCIEVFHRGLTNRSSNGSCTSVANRCSDIDVRSVLAGLRGPRDEIWEFEMQRSICSNTSHECFGFHTSPF